MKKILLLLVLLILLPITTNAASNVEIKDLTFISKSDNTEIVQDAKVDGLKLNFNLKFYQVGDNAKYKFTIKNNSTKDYEIETGTSFSKDKVIKYEFQVDGNNKILKAKEEKNMTVTISYNIKVDDSKYVDGKYIAEDILNINLSNNKIIANPKTANSKIIIAIVIMIVLSTIAVLIYSQKQTFLPFIILILLIPVTTIALEKITINVDSKVEINKTDHFDYKYEVGTKANIEFEPGMTFDNFINSRYFNLLTREEQLKLMAGFNSTCDMIYVNKEYDTCIENATTEEENEKCYSDYTTEVDQDDIIKNNRNGYYSLADCK